jgi:hypothetical protein
MSTQHRLERVPLRALNSSVASEPSRVDGLPSQAEPSATAASSAAVASEPIPLPSSSPPAGHASNIAGVVLVKPAAAVSHADTWKHRVGPTTANIGITSQKASIIWDINAPIELDARPWRCLTCQQHRRIIDETCYWAPSAVDVQKAYPDALHLPANKHHGTFYFTSQWLLHYFLVLYETFCFRAARRRMLDTLFAQAAGSKLSGDRLRFFVSVFPDDEVGRDIEACSQLQTSAF